MLLLPPQMSISCNFGYENVYQTDWLLCCSEVSTVNSWEAHNITLFVLVACLSPSLFLFHIIYPGSIASLVAGVLFGVLAGVGAYRMSQSSDNFWVSLGWLAL